MRGFSLLELLVATTIAAILAAAALPSYRGYVLRGNRMMGRSALLDFASKLEGRFAEDQRYPISLPPGCSADASGETWLTRDGRCLGSASTAAIYRVRLVATATSYLLEAAPVNAQAADASCGTLRYDSDGGHGASGPLGPACWR
jgi:type IV pilus assembly protein PilE